MSFENSIFSIYFFSVALGIITSAILLLKLRKSSSKLPGRWQKTLPLKKFKKSICLLLIFLLNVIISDAICTYLSRHHIYNNYVISIYYTVSTPFLFGFLFINTQKYWKQYAYVILYLILVGYLISGGYYHPRSVHTSITNLLFNSVYFLAALLHLTDLLMKPKLEYFKFQLKINLAFLIWSLLSTIITSFLSARTEESILYFNFFFFIHVFIIILLYLSFSFIFITEIMKLRRG